ncbi:MAG: hypothetical protein IJJ35_06770 [Exiguobacterium sp.]|jgi:hypothetical protein|uniref:Dnd system-associated protein 4 n=1 Tax=Exiguobacterium sp. (strain ATCC BAA-1283 / AT1b) TaxID=360911 RepID=C4L4D5_EXISA|nr:MULTISPECIES: hypothetical protein [unclassified Exiguobacterium]ACQ71498.1 hypothetical protein EAT1b_2580 [Exiguobacterium sp. AT1b]MBQ6459286.1 hypothetical protein [Exiguobacterium sp.]QUP86391.1 hypothetical protein KD909_10555 [Exiguobacterium sp. PFWT01]
MAKRSVRRDSTQDHMYTALKEDAQLFETYKDAFMAALLFGYSNERRKKVKPGPEILLGIFSEQDLQFMKLIMHLENTFERFSIENDSEDESDVTLENYDIIEEYAAGGLDALYQELEMFLTDPESAQNAYLDLMLKYEQKEFNTEDLINELPFN